MPTQPAPKKPAAPAKLKLLPFAFPFLRKGQGQSKASTQFTNEHAIYRLLKGGNIDYSERLIAYNNVALILGIPKGMA